MRIECVDFILWNYVRNVLKTVEAIFWLFNSKEQNWSTFKESHQQLQHIGFTLLVQGNIAEKLTRIQL